MTDRKHTRTPWHATDCGESPDDSTTEWWRVGGDQWHDGEGFGRVVADLYGREADPTCCSAEANAKRIVACVNACEGINNPAAIGGVIAALREVIARVASDEGEAGWLPLSHNGTLEALRGALEALDRKDS